MRGAAEREYRWQWFPPKGHPLSRSKNPWAAISDLIAARSERVQVTADEVRR